MIIRVRVDADRVSDEFKEARRQINARTKEGLIEAGRKAVEPHVRRHAPSITLPFLRVHATSRRLFITTRGARKGDRITGLLNFGGTVTTQIRPKDKQALKLGNTGVIVAAVNKPRRYKGKHFMEHARDQSLPEVERVLLPTVMKSFDGLEHSP